MNISNWIASTGENPNLIAFFAHSGVAAYVMSRFPHGLTRMLVAVPAIVLAAAKEIWDVKHEHTPPQTWKDSALDFTGYMTGIVVGTFLP